MTGGSSSNGYFASDFVLARYQADGSLDHSFDGDGKIIAAGSNFHDFALARYQRDGSLDVSFDGDSKVTTRFGIYGTQSVQALALQSNNKILAAGTDGFDFALARYLAPIPDLLPIRLYMPVVLKRR